MEDDLIARAVRQLAAALARTSAVEVRAEGEIETQRAEAALGRARERLARGDVRGALADVDAAIASLTQLSASTALRLDARSLLALTPVGGRRRLARLFSLRGVVLEACGLDDQAAHAASIARALSP